MLRVVTRGKSGGDDDSKGMDNGDGPDPMVGAEAVNVGKESAVGSPTSAACRVLPALLQQSDTDVMTEYEQIAANKAHLDANVDPTRRHLKVIFVLWCGKYGLNKLGSKSNFTLQ